MPVLNDVDGSPRVFYIGWYIRDAQRHPDVPRLTPDQLDALGIIETIANDPCFHVQMDFQPGDVQLLNNAKILHSREAYEDHDDAQRAAPPPALVAQRARLRECRGSASGRHPGARRIGLNPAAESTSGWLSRQARASHRAGCWMPPPKSGTSGQRVVNVAVEGSSSTSSRCGVARNATSTTTRPSSSRAALAAIEGVDDRPRLGQGHLDRAVALAEDHPPFGGLDARHAVVRRRTRRARRERHGRHLGCLTPATLGHGRQRQAAPTAPPAPRRPAMGDDASPAMAGRRCSHIRSRMACMASRAREHRHHGVLLGQHDHELAERAVAPVAVPRPPQLEAVPLPPVHLRLPRVVDLPGRRVRDPALREDPTAVPHPVVEVELPEPGHRVEVGVHAGEAHVETRAAPAPSAGR